MSVGGRLLGTCCGALSNSQIPTCPLTTITIQTNESNTFVTASLLYPAAVVKHNYPYTDLNEYVFFYGTKSIDSNPNNAERYNLLNFGTVNGTWSVTSNSIVTETGSYGPIVRPGTNVVIVNAPFKARQYTFSRNSCTIVYAPNQATYVSNTHDDYLCGCNSCATTMSDLGSERGATQTLLNKGPATITLTWVGVCSRPVSGITLSLKPAGIAVGPWTIEANGTSVILTNGSGSTSTYTGTLSSVVASINSAGFFTATLPGVVTANALTSDLKVSKSNPIKTNCFYEGLLIALTGDEIAPGIAPPPGGFYLTAQLSVNALAWFDSSASGYPPTAAGALQYFTQGVYPLAPSSYPGWGEIYSDNLSLAMTFTGLGWKRTPGASSVSRTYTIGALSSTSLTESNIICFGCYSDPFDPPDCGGLGTWSPGFSVPFGYWSFNPYPESIFGPPGAWLNVCTGATESACPGLSSPGSFSIYTVTSTPIATSTETARYEVSGRFFLS